MPMNTMEPNDEEASPFRSDPPSIGQYRMTYISHFRLVERHVLR